MGKPGSSSSEVSRSTLKILPPQNVSYLLSLSFKKQLILFRMGIFGLLTDEWWGGGGAKSLPVPKICHTYPTKMKLGTLIVYLRKIQKLYELSDTPPELC